MVTNRKETVERLIKQFENHLNRDMLLQDFKKTEEINPFSEESNLITDVGNTEIFEFGETSSKKQCPDCALHWEVGIPILHMWQMPAAYGKEMNKERFDVLSIPGIVIRHGPSMRQTLYFKAHDMLWKARSNKNGNCKTIIERWYRDDKYRKSFSDIGWTEEQIKQYDALAWENHCHAAAPEERSRYQKSWKISVNKEEIQGPIKQRPDFCEAKQKCTQRHKEHVERTGEGNSPLHPAHQTRHNDQRFEGLDEYNHTVDPRTGWRFYPSTRPTTSSSSAHWEQHDDWKSNQSWNFLAIFNLD